MKKRRTITLLLAAAALLAALAAALLYYNKISLNRLVLGSYEVRGIDLSEYQGEVDWNRFSSQGISFAYIKATEGSGYVDDKFYENWSRAAQTSLRIGAYHFFSFDSSGATQAENFINAVPRTENMLPPAVDVELYGSHIQNPFDRDGARVILRELLEGLEEHYGMKPVIYVTRTSYDLYISGDFEEYDIWIRNVRTPPRLSDSRDWTFWQYSARGRLEGYSGAEEYIDLNVFYGTAEQFRLYPNGE